VTTQHTDYEHNDVDMSVVELSFAQETETALSTETEMAIESSSITPFAPINTHDEADQDHEKVVQSEGGEHILSPAAQGHAESQSETPQDQVAPERETSLFKAETEEQEAVHNDEAGALPAEQLSKAAQSAEPAAEAVLGTVEVMPLVGTREEIRPFTDYIEEFRQAEAKLNPSFQETPVQPFTHEEEFLQSTVQTPAVADSDQSFVQEASSGDSSNETAPTSPVQPVERPVSPLLRPATRLRLPRHGNLRLREVHTGQTPSEATAQPTPTPAEVEPARPTRRYRFDRPAEVGAATQPPAQENRGTAPSTRLENGNVALNGNAVEASAKSTANLAQLLEQEKQPAVGQEAGTTDNATVTEQERRRRPGQERQKEKEVEVPLLLPVAPQQEEIAAEDLPPLEYSELQKASSRRRRRHRSSTNSNGTAALAATTPPVSNQVTPVAPLVTPDTLASPDLLPAATPGVPLPNQYGIVSGYTVNQMNQGNDANGPFMGPEPSPARGSVLGRDGHTMRAEAQRTPAYPVRPSEPASSPTSINQLAGVLSQSIHMQTDRIVAELRRANQAPTNISVSLPPFPSTERVGVFVDVANLLYSARTLRIAVDFGRLLDFLRGNRRLIRAHAYCPTSPQPGEEQMFLQAVKGLGYRITTKNYKTFSSGAKKADLDLDLCMDVVRLVEGKAVDCVVLVSGDSDFMPMLDYCSDHGVRVEVAAFDEAMSATLRQSCDLFVNLSMLEEIRA